MTQAERELVVLMTRGTDHELSSVAFTIACGGLTAGMQVRVFLTSAAVDLVRRGSAASSTARSLTLRGGWKVASRAAR